ncbi:MAG: hypothetical protein JST00_47630 [Deltaproteobacteria bacterium]|nr:hypothetical protein [Deltaproteobacteria bacterium]
MSPHASRPRRMTLLATTLLASALLLIGCNQCRALEERICSDLGADHCAVWKELGGVDNVMKAGRGSGRACGQIASTPAAYDGILLGQRGLVLGELMKRASAKGDKAEVDRLRKQMDENAARIRSSIPGR